MAFSVRRGVCSFVASVTCACGSGSGSVSPTDSGVDALAPFVDASADAPVTAISAS
jgi:hypothetical protein